MRDAVFGGAMNQPIGFFMWFPTKPGTGWRKVSTRRGYKWTNHLWFKRA